MQPLTFGGDYPPEELPRHLGYLDRVVVVVTEGRFQLDEGAAVIRADQPVFPGTQSMSPPDCAFTHRLATKKKSDSRLT